MLRATTVTLTLLAALPPALAQTAATHHTTATHRTAISARAAANPADNPPGVPHITAAPKPLYTLRYVDIVIGTGPIAQPQKFYTVKYTGWLTDGTKFDSSYDHPGGEPITFAYGAHRVIPGWDTGFEGMRVGGKRRLYIPYQLAYGEAGREGAIPPRADLIFDLELVSFSDNPPAPAAPPQSQPQSQQPSAPQSRNSSETGAEPPQKTAEPQRNLPPSAPPESPAPQPSANPN